MNVNIYCGSKKTVEKSGVGRAMEHQQTILEKAHVKVNEGSLKNADIIHFNTVFPDSVINAIAARIRGQKVVYYGHSTMEDFKNSFIGSDLAAPLFKMWIKFCYSLGDVIITPTDYSKRLLESYGIKKPIYAVSNGIDDKFWKKDAVGAKRFREKYGISKECKVVLSVGHYIGRKGIVEFIDLAKKMPEITFVWMGYTELCLVPAEIRNAIKNAPENVILPGYVSKEELRDAYSGSDIFAFMSHEETEGIVILEGLAAGITTLVRDIPVYNDWLTDGRDVYKCKEDADFEKRIRSIFDGQTVVPANMGKEVVKNHTYTEMGHKLLGVYADIYDTKTQKYGRMKRQMLYSR